MRKMKRIKTIVGALIIAVLVLGNIFIPLQSALAYDSSGAVAVARGAYYDLPKTVENYASSGKTLEFDLNFQIKSSDNCKLRLYDGSSQVSGEFLLQNGEAGLKMSTESIEDGWYHYIISLLSVPRSAEQETSSVSRIRVATTFPTGSKINNISIGQDVQALPESLTDDYDTVTLADLGIAGTDYKTAVSSGTYTYKGKSKTNSVIVKLGWEANVSSSVDWKLALDTYWNANCMVWFRPDYIYFCPGDGDYRELYERISPVTSGKHEIEFGRMRVTAGPNSDKDYVFLKIDGQVRAYKYTDYYQTEGGYVSHSGKTTVPSYTVCFVNDGVAMQGFSGFAEPDKYVTDVDYVNIGEIVPGGVVKDTIHDNYLGYTYPFTGSSKTHSTVVKYVLKTSQYAEGNLDGSVMVVDIGGNCGFCRSYISSGNKKSIMFGWEIEGCSSGTKSFTFAAKNWYAFEQGRLRVTSGVNKGKDYIYIKIDGKVISSFYGEPDSRPLLGNQIYVEATQSFQVTGYDEARAKYYVDGELYLDSLAQKGLTLKKPKDPQKNNNYFVGWYTKESGGTLFDFEKQTITSDINLYARFTSETVTLNFDPANGGIAYNVPSGKDCLVSEPTAPTYSDGTYEYVFAGWKNKATGKIFDFATERLSEDAEFVAVYKEKEYYVSYYANGKLVKKVPFVLSDPTVSGKEPAVPSIPNTTGVWENHSVSGLKGNMTVNAVYTVKVPSSTTAVALTKYSGSKVYLNTDTIHDFLSTDTDKQSDYVREFCASPHEYQDYQNTSFAWTDSGKNSKYTVYFADNSDFKDAYIVTSKSTSLVNKVGIFLPGKTYYWFVCGNDTGKCSAVDSFKTVDTPIRYITAGNVINMRDLGGQVNSNGERVKYELVYRGAALDEFTSHVDDTARGVFNYLGINSEIELRGGMNHDYTGWDENNPNVNYIQGAMYQEILELSAAQVAQYKSTFEAMADKNNYPFYFHCSAGADRTGTFAYLLYGLLGVPYDDIRPEYELTSFSAIGVRPADDYHNGFAIDTTNSQMLEKYGEGTGNLQTAIRNFLMNKVGLSAATLDAIKNIMLDDGSSQNEKPYTLTVDVLGKKYTYKAFDGIYFMPDSPQAMGKIFKGFYTGSTKYNGYAKSDLNLTAKFEDISYEPYDTISLDDLGIEENKIITKTNKVYRYEKLVKGGTGGRLLQFILEPIGDMKNGDGPQLAITNDWSVNSYARAWFQTNTMSYAYYNGVLGSGPDVSKMVSLKAGKQYNIEFAVRVMKNKGYEGKKVFEITIDGELLVQYIGCQADLSDNMIFFHGAEGSAYLINKPVSDRHTVTVNVLGKKYTSRAMDGVYFMPEAPQAAGKIFKGFYNGKKEYDGYANGDISLTAKFEDIQYESYDTLTLRDLGVQEVKILNQTNTVYTYDKKAKSGGRLLRFVMEPIGDMKGGDGPHVALTNDWNENSNARVWFQSNEWTHVYYGGTLGTPPDISKELSLEAGKQYNVEFSVRVMKNKGYEGKKVLEVTVNGELIAQYIGCKADLSENKIYFHGATGAVYLSNLTSYKIHTLTIDVLGKKFDYPAFEGVYSMPNTPQAPGKIFTGFYNGKTKYDGYAKSDLKLTAKFDKIEYESYDTLTLRDLGVQEVKILNQTNTVYTYDKKAKSGGRLLRFILEPIGDMKGGDGPQLALTNDWNENSNARIWFQSNEWTQVYYSGTLGTPPDISKKLPLEAGKEYKIEYSVRIMKNKGYEGKKILEVTVNGELLVQYIGCKADLSENKIYFHGATGAAYLSNLTSHKIHTLTIDVLGKKFDYPAFEGVYSMPNTPQAPGKIFRGFYNGKTKYNGYTKKDLTLTAKFEDIKYEAYDTITLRDLGVQEEKILNQTNTVYTYDKKAKSGGRLLRFIMEPIGDMKGGDGPQLALTNDWNENSNARIWFQSNEWIQVYYSGTLGTPPDISKKLPLEAGKEYKIEYSVRIMKNKGYEGKKIFEVTVNGELVVQYIGCKADLSENKIYFHGATGAAYLSNLTSHKIHTLTIDVLGSKFNYPAFEGVYSMPDSPKAPGKLFKGFYDGKTKYNGYTKKDLNLTAKFEDIEFEPYDTLTLRDLGVQENKILNQTNTVYTYEKTAKSGGRLLQFILEPIGDMKGGDGPQLALTNDWEQNSAARVWFQSNEWTQVYYSGKLGNPPDISQKLSLEAGKQYNIKFSVRVMKNKGYEGKKIFEITVNGELLVQYIGCTADLSENKIYFHGGTGSAYLINKPVYKTVKFYNGNTLMGTYKVERCSLIPKVEEPEPQGGLPFAGWYSEKSGGKLWDENADPVYQNMSLYAHFANVRVIKAKIDGKTLIYRVPVGETLDSLPKPQKSGHVFMGWTVNGKIFDGKVTRALTVEASFEEYSFDDYDELSLRDLGVSGKLYTEAFGDNNNEEYHYYKAAKTGGRVFKAIYVPTENMMNGPQISFSHNWDENYFSKLYFTKYDKLYVYSSGIDGGLPTLTLDTELVGGKKYPFEIGVRVLNNKGYKGIKVLTVYLGGELIFEEFDNGTNLDGDVVFFQGLPKTGYFLNVDVYKTVSFYDGDKLLSSQKILRGKTVNSIGKLANKGDRLFMSWVTEFGKEWNFDTDAVYLDTVLLAKYQKRTYPVLLMVDDVLYKRLNITVGECVDVFDVPKKEGYDFERWLSEDGSEYDMQTPVNSPLVLVASFAPAKAKTEPIGNIIEPDESSKASSPDFIYILLGAIGLVIIAAEVFAIVYIKRSKK